MFFTDHDEIVSRAKKEGKVRVFSGQDSKSLKTVTEAFKKKYPFIDVRAEPIDGTEIYQRMFQEMKADAREEYFPSCMGPLSKDGKVRTGTGKGFWIS